MIWLVGWGGKESWRGASWRGKNGLGVPYVSAGQHFTSTELKPKILGTRQLKWRDADGMTFRVYGSDFSNFGLGFGV